MFKIWTTTPHQTIHSLLYTLGSINNKKYQKIVRPKFFIKHYNSKDATYVLIIKVLKMETLLGPSCQNNYYLLQSN
jgi:hypothetical protein